nr:hypothetical protein [Candidatus Peribacteraceae bacterium]
ALMGIGYGTGDSRAAEAAHTAIDSPLLELSISGAQGILFNITGGTDLSMFEVDEAARVITETAAPEANIIFGAVIDENYTGQVKCTVIATGFDNQPLNAPMSMVSPLQRTLKTAAPIARGGQQDHGGRDQNSHHQPNDGMLQSTAPQVNMEELEVPAFMRKPISK